MRPRSVALFIALLLTGCGNSTRAEELKGEWRFADTRNATTPPDAMTPPLFDVIQISPPASIVLRDSLRNRTFNGTYSVRDGILRWTFKPSDTPSPVEHAVHFSFARDGALVLRSAQAKHSVEQDADWVFLRPERFVASSTVAGDWLIPGKNGKPASHWLLRPDGTLGSDATDDSFRGFYRVWRNKSNDLMITTLLWVRGEGAFAMFQRVEPQGDTMKVTGRVPPGFPDEPPETWRRASQR